MIVIQLRRHFCEYVLAWKRTGKLAAFIEVNPDGSYPTDERALELDLLTGVDPQNPVPDDVAAALDLPAGSSFGAAVVPVIAALHAPIVPTPEDEAEDEMNALQFSELCELFNEWNPDLEPLPVAYPKATRRRQ